MSDLVEFLLARIAEDEAMALGHEHDGAAAGGRVAVAWARTAARVLAECDAKRRIVGWHSEQDDECCEERFGPLMFDAEPELSASTDSFGNLTMRQSIGVQPFIGCVTLMMLALPYSEHPDYREDWRP